MFLSRKPAWFMASYAMPPVIAPSPMTAMQWFFRPCIDVTVGLLQQSSKKALSAFCDKALSAVCTKQQEGRGLEALHMKHISYTAATMQQHPLGILCGGLTTGLRVLR